MKKIIVPVDFSEVSMRAMDFAVELSKKIDAEIILIHVLAFPISQFSFAIKANREAMENFYTKEFIEELHNKLDQWSAILAKEKVSVRALMKYGHPFKKISGTLAEEKADFIVMGSNGVSGIKEFLVGSNAARMVRYADCPVIIIKDETHIKDFKIITFTTDGTVEQDKIAEKVKEIQTLFGAHIHLVKIKTPYNWLEDSQVIAQIENYANRNGFENYSIDTLTTDYIDEGAIKYAEEHDCGLIIMGTHGRTGLSHLFGGSTAEEVVNESKIPVMTIKLN